MKQRQLDYDYTLETLIGNIEVLKEEYEMLTEMLWDAEELSATEREERRQRLKALLATVDIMASLAERAPTAEEVQECMKTKTLLENQITQLKATLSKSPKVSQPKVSQPKVVPSPRTEGEKALAELNKKQLNDLVKLEIQKLGRSLKDLNEALKLRFDKTLSKLTKSELQEILELPLGTIF